MKRNILVSVSLVLTLLGGASLSTIPDYEVAYSGSKVFSSSTGAGCVTFYQLRAGNTGWYDQERVQFVISTKMLEQKITALRVLATGVVSRPFELEEEEGTTIVTYGELKSSKWIDLTFSTQHESCSAAPDPAEVFLEVRPGAGSAKPGDPNLLRFGRFLYGFLNLF